MISLFDSLKTCKYGEMLFGVGIVMFHRCR